MSERSRSRERDGLATNTNSNDPKLLHARLFIGNLATDKVSRADLVNIFGKYGRVIGISLLRGYGFVQYETTEEARAAVDAENNTLVKGQKIDVKMAAEGRKKVSRRSPPPPRRGRGDEREHRDRSPIRNSRDSYDDSYSEPPHPRRPPPNRDGYQREPREPREPPPARYPREPYREPYPPRPARAPAPPAVTDCEIIMLSPKVRGYADAIESRLRAQNLVAHQIGLSSPDTLPKALEDITQRGMLYAIVINEDNESHHSLTMNILHGTPQEHRNMPFEDALTLVQRNFEEYRKKRLENAVKPAAAAAAAVTATPSEFLKPDPKQAYLLNLLADNRYLIVEELNTVIQYLTLRRDKILQKEAEKKVSSVLNDESSIVQQQQELQARILSILGSNSTAAPTPTPDPYAAQQQQQQQPQQQQPQQHQQQQQPQQHQQLQQQQQPQQQHAAAAANTAINFNNPSVQQAIDNLMASGGIKAAAAAPPAPPPPSSYAHQPPTPGVYQAYGVAPPLPAAPPQPPPAQPAGGYPYSRY